MSQIHLKSALFDKQQILDKIRQTGELIPTLRDVIKNSQQVLADLFFQETGIKDLIHLRANLVDQVLELVYQHLVWPEQTIALVAVGGYGRGELHPHSDIDLLLLTGQDITPELQHAIESLWTTLWDIGLEVGHSVRSVEACRTAAEQDISIATNLMEARFLYGDKTLFQQLTQTVNANTVWTGDSFFKAKMAEQKARHKKHNNTEYNLEPNIKSAPGALRDIQTIGWIAKRHFGADQLKELVSHQFLTEGEYHLIDAGQTFLWRLRFALHIHTGRDENRLLFDHQRAIAKLMGYKDQEAQLAVEQLMKRYYRVAIAISELNDLLTQYFDEAIVRAREPENVTPVNERFQIRNHFIEVTHPDVFKQTPSALLEIFVLMAQTPEILGVRARTIRLIRDHRHLVNETFRNTPHNNELFMALLRAPYKLFTQLRRMKRYGILSRYLPAFGKIIGQMQFDLFHIYTVDAHILLVIKNIRMFRYPSAMKQFPIAARLVQELPKLELLYLAALFHDLAKGRGGDHSTLGATDARDFCLNHRLSNWDAHLVSWLVENHLLMSMTAQKKDISDPEVINEFALKIGDPIHLDYLYTLTVADICATNPKLWNAWRASLLATLHTETRRVLRRGKALPLNKDDQITETRARALTLLRNMGIEDSKILALWNKLGDEYFLREKSEDIAWHAQAIIQHQAQDLPLVAIREPLSKHLKGGIQIFIYTKDRMNLFFASVATLDQLSLSILDARIITSPDNTSLDTYFVQMEDASSFDEHPGKLQEIARALTHTLTHMETFSYNARKRVPRQLKPFKFKTEVFISNDLKNQRTLIEVQTLDRPGLLAKTASIFSEFHLQVQSARIATLGERAEDIFFITDENQKPLQDAQLCETIRVALCSRLDEL